MNETQTRARARDEEDRLDLDEAKLWRGEIGPNVADELLEK